MAHNREDIPLTERSERSWFSEVAVLFAVVVAAFALTRVGPRRQNRRVAPIDPRSRRPSLSRAAGGSSSATFSSPRRRPRPARQENRNYYTGSGFSSSVPAGRSTRPGRPRGRRGHAMADTHLEIAASELVGVILMSVVAVLLAVIVAAIAFGP